MTSVHQHFCVFTLIFDILQQSAFKVPLLCFFFWILPFHVVCYIAAKGLQSFSLSSECTINGVIVSQKKEPIMNCLK